MATKGDKKYQTKFQNIAKVIAYLSWYQQSSLILFAAVIITFFLPFISLKFINQGNLQLSGLQLTTGLSLAKIGDFSSVLSFDAQQKSFFREPLATLALVYALIGLVISTIKAYRITLISAIASATGAVFLLVIKYRFDQYVLRQGIDLVQVDYGVGFWLVLSLFLAASLLNWLIFFRESKSGKFLEGFALLAPAGLWLLLLLVLPTLVIFELSLVPGIRPGEVVNPSGIENYLRVFETLNLIVLGRSLFFATGTTIICLILGFPVAYWIAQIAPQRWRNLLILGFILPLWTSSLLRTYAWITILRPTGILNSILQNLSLPTLEILNTSSAVLVGMAYSYLPYMVLILYASLEKLDRQLLEAAADLGANSWVTFWKVTVPQTIPGITAGSLLVFITGLGDFVDPELLGGASSMTISRLIYNQFLGASRNWGFGSALSMVLILGVSFAIALFIKYADNSTIRS